MLKALMICRLRLRLQAGYISLFKELPMNPLSIAIIVFIILETMNIALLYFAPSSKKGNGVGVFNAFEKSKDYPEIHSFIKYLVNWVAGTKLIFIALLIVVLITGTDQTKLFAVGALILSILSFYWRLYPAIRAMDNEGQISPKGYSRTLFVMISVFIAGFTIALALALF